MDKSIEQKYVDLLNEVWATGTEVMDRTGVGTRKVIGRSLSFPLDPFPIIRGKKVLTGPLFTELEWFIQGKTNVKYLVERNCNIWTAWAYEAHKSKLPESMTLPEYKAALIDGSIPEEYGQLGPVYGKQWRDFEGVDQLAKAVDGLISNPHGRRHIVNSWNVPYIDTMALPPCHLLYQFHVEEPKSVYLDPIQRLRAKSGKAISLTMYQRSADLFLGVPFNISSYAALAHWMSMMTGYAVGNLTMFFGDAHVYTNHEEAVAKYTQQFEAVGDMASTCVGVQGTWSPTFNMTGYDHQQFIKAPVAV